ncbi:MAG: DUF1302 family protein [bacterium]
MAKRAATVWFLTGFLLAAAATAEGFDFSIGESISGTVKGDLTYTARLRTEYPDWKLEGLASGDSNFDKGDLVNNKFIERVEIETQFGEYVTFFGRDEVFVDTVFFDEDKYRYSIRKHAAYNFTDALEYYLEGHYGDLTVRAGRQIVQWGDSVAPVFAQGVNTISQFFGAKVAAAGYTLRDYQVPSHMVWISYEFLENWSVEPVWAPDFDPRYAMPVVGTYQSFSDSLGFGEDGAIDDQRPKKFVDQQQYGAAIHKVFPGLKNFELGFYYFHHKDHAPAITFDLATDPKPVATYPGIDMYGMSFSQAFEELGLNLQVNGELAYRPNDILQRNLIVTNPIIAQALGIEVGDSLGAIGGYDEGKTLTWVFGGSRLFSDCLSFTPWTFAMFAMYEFYGKLNLEYEDEKNYSDPEKTAYYMLSLPLSVADLVPRTNLTFQFDGSGTLHSEQNSLHRFSFSFKARYGDNWEGLVGYDYVVGEAEQNVGPNNMSDRDALTFKFTWYWI